MLRLCAQRPRGCGKGRCELRTCAEHCPHQNVFSDSHAVECRRRLEHAPHTEMADVMGRRPGDVVAGEDDIAVVCRHDTGDYIEKSCLSGPVRTADPENLTSPDLETEILYRCHGAEIFADATADQQRLFVFEAPCL